MIYRQSVDVDVVAVISTVNDAAHVMSHQRLIADDNPFGLGFGSAGVGHLARVFNVEDSIRLGCRIRIHPLVEVFEPIAHRWLACALIGPDQGFHGGHIVKDVFHQVVESVLHDEHRAFGMINAVGDVFSRAGDS